MKLSKREPKHMGEVMSDIAERYDKLTKTKKMMSKELKGIKCINDKGYVYVPYIHMETIRFPNITCEYDKDCKVVYKKINKDE
jgi:hypothetical protein